MSELFWEDENILEDESEGIAHNTEITESFKASGACLSNISQDAGI